MKCPKCSFNSFEFLDNCKKCGADLVSYKKNLGINPVIYTPGPLLMETHEIPATGALLEEAPLAAASAVPSSDEVEDTFAWDIPAFSETPPETDTAFSGFDLGFIKEDVKPDEPETGFSFGEEPPTEATDASEQETAVSFEEFSFYEETLDPEENRLFSGAEEEPQEVETDLFGETGVMGEILPEQLQATCQEPRLDGSVNDSLLQPERYENEFVLEDFVDEDEEEGTKEKDERKDPLDFSDFEKEFESIFQTDEQSDSGKAEN